MDALQNLIHSLSNENIKDFFRQKINTFSSKDEEDLSYNLNETEQDDFSLLIKLGDAKFEGSDRLLVFSCAYEGELTARSSKKKQFNIAKKILNEDFKDGAIFIFYDEKGRFRFSFIRKYYGEKKETYSPWRRFTYFVSSEKNNRTFIRRFDKCDFSSLDEIQEAFSVEELSKEFYTKLSHWYFASLNDVTFPNDVKENQHQINSQAMIRLITRMMFVWFMKQKKLIPDEIFEEEYLEKILNYQDKTESTYYKAILQNLFFATLNTEMSDKRKWITISGYGIQHFYRYKRYFKETAADDFIEMMKKIPFLNGGLFENLDIVETANKKKNIPKKDIRIDCFSDNPKNEERLVVPDILFFGKRKTDISTSLNDSKKNNIEVDGLIDILQRYDFTIDENSLDDQEVALDPELLGTVFENLLASYNPETQSTARKESGSFYTPRPIVDYMVKESLFYHLKDKSKLEDEKLHLLIDANETKDLTEEEKHLLVDNLTHIKILDPACGSGAFPMGALQQMVRLLNLLDPENQIYKEKLQQKLKADLTKTIDKSNFEELKTNIEEVFSNQLNDPDYARKLFLIQNCLFGVDIQSIAMQITKLRFFISLLVEQQIDKKEANLGVKPLPNLETKFVAANTLIGLNRLDGKLKNLKIESLEDDLAEVREKYFGARSYKTKRKYRTADKELRNEIAELLIDDGWENKTAKQIAQWDPFDQNAESNWFDPEWMFGIENFDVVIGNPPYIQLQKTLPADDTIKYADLYINENYKTFQRTGDIYALFYEQGLNLAKGGGLLCYITSNKWMRANYGKSLRKFFSTKNPLCLLDLGPGIFDAATVDTNILIIRDKKVKQHQLKAFPLEYKEQINTLDNSKMVNMDKLSEESWIILKPEEMAIKEKIERIGSPLKDWDINIYRGILTGFNEAFIIDGEKRKELIKQNPKSAEIIKPILRGRDIKRYKAEFADLWLIFIPWHFPLNEDPTVSGYSVKAEAEFKKGFPAVYNHLFKFKEKLSKRNKAETGIRYEWYALQRCAASYYREFEKEKIVYSEIVKEPQFYLDTKGAFFPEATTFILTGKAVKYLYGLLHSSPITFFFKEFYAGGGLGEKGYRYKKVFLEKLPIPKIPKAAMQPFEDLVNQIHTKKENDEDSSAEEQEIDLLVYKLYELTYKEVKIVDSAFGMSEEEYEKTKI